MADESDAKQFPNIFLSLFLAEMMVHQICYCVRGHESYSISVDDITRRRNFSLVEIDSLLVVKSLVTRCKIRLYSLQKFLVAKSHSLLVSKFAHYYPLQKLLVAKSPSLLVAKFTRYALQKMFAAKKHSLLVAKFARYSLQKFTGYSLENSHVVKN